MAVHRFHRDKHGLALALPVRRIAFALLATAWVAACSSVRFGTERQEAPASDEKADALHYGQQAELLPIGGSAVSGKVRVIDRGDGSVVLISLMNVSVGDFRIAFHADANCSSPNGYSAGPAWAPAGRRPEELVPVQRANSEDHAEVTVRVRGLHATGAAGVTGRSVIVYAGSNIEPLRPGVRNNAIACGVFRPATPISF
jgi:Cu/Zn superoxide dismutase